MGRINTTVRRLDDGTYEVVGVASGTVVVRVHVPHDAKSLAEYLAVAVSEWMNGKKKGEKK